MTKLGYYLANLKFNVNVTRRGSMRFIHKVYDIFTIVVLIVTALFCARTLFVDILRPLSPVITILFAAIVTLMAFRHRTAAILSVGGLSLYAISWLAVGVYGTYVGMFVCLLGIVAWLYASFLPTFMEARQITA